MNQNPVHEFKSGNIRAVIWHNNGKSGKPDYHSILIVRRYRIGEEWKETTSLLLNDVAKAVDVLTKAQQWLEFGAPSVA